MDEPVTNAASEVVEPPKPSLENLAVKQPTQEMAVAQPGQNMWLSGQNFADAMRMAKVLSTAPMVPQAYRNEPGNCLIAIDMAQRMNMPPMMIMQNLYIVQGNPAWSGQACIALINACGRFTPLKFKQEQKDGHFACTAYATEIATGETVYGTTVDDNMAKSCGWMDKNGSFWKKMPMQMAMYRSAAFFARAYCPQALMGLYDEYEQRDIHGYE